MRNLRLRLLVSELAEAVTEAWQLWRLGNEHVVEVELLEELGPYDVELARWSCSCGAGGVDCASGAVDRRIWEHMDEVGLAR